MANSIRINDEVHSMLVWIAGYYKAMGEKCTLQEALKRSVKVLINSIDATEAKGKKKEEI